MIDIALCIAVDHDPWLVLLAVFICCVGAFAVAQMFERARSTAGLQRFGWIFLTSVGSGATIWCTHFVAMIAFKAKVPVDLDPVLTIISLMVAVVGTFAGFTVAIWRPRRAFAIVGGVIVGSAISGMHFMGMAAYRVDGIVAWRWPYVVASVLCAIGFSAAALMALVGKESRHRVPLGPVLLVIAIATLHFVAMTALHITPLTLSETSLKPEEMRGLALATALVGLMVIA